MAQRPAGRCRVGFRVDRLVIGGEHRRQRGAVGRGEEQPFRGGGGGRAELRRVVAHRLRRVVLGVEAHRHEAHAARDAPVLRGEVLQLRHVERGRRAEVAAARVDEGDDAYAAEKELAQRLLAPVLVEDAAVAGRLDRRQAVAARRRQRKGVARAHAGARRRRVPLMRRGRRRQRRQRDRDEPRCEPSPSASLLRVERRRPERHHVRPPELLGREIDLEARRKLLAVPGVGLEELLVVGAGLVPVREHRRRCSRAVSRPSSATPC